MASDHQPGDPAPHTGHYEELKVFGSETGNVVYARKGDALPSAPHGFTWRLSQKTEC